MMPPSAFPQRQKSTKIPIWVWVLTVVGLLLMVGVYSGLYWGFNKVQDIARTQIAKANPDFELLYLTNTGKWKVRHKPSGKEFLVDAPAGKIALLRLTSEPVNPTPDWIKLRDAAPYAAKSGWDRMGDTGMLLEGIEALFLDHDFVTEVQNDSTITACNPKLLQCVVVTYGFVESQDNRSWYSAKFFTAP